MIYLNTLQAQEVIDRATERAKEISVNASISVVDSGAHLIAFRRMDGSAIGSGDVSQRKARTAALFGFDSGDFGKIIGKLKLTGMEHSNGGLAAFPGGIPILSKQGIAGAIGVSGGSPEQDLDIASYALDNFLDNNA